MTLDELITEILTDRPPVVDRDPGDEDDDPNWHQRAYEPV